MEPPSSFASLLRRTRQASGLTQEELAERARLSCRAVSDLERGVKRPRRDTVTLLAEALTLAGEARAVFDLAARQPIPVSDPNRAARPESETHDVPRVDSPSALPVGGYLGAVPLHPLVARDEELTRLSRGLGAASAGAGQLLLLAGEPGVGKTRLAQEVMLHARTTGMAVLVGRCQERIDTPYAPLDDVLRAAWTLASPALRSRASERFPELGRLLPQVVPAPTAADGDDARRGLLRAMAGFLAALATEQPLAILLDDLHWANSAGLDALAHLAHALRADPVFILGTYRDMEISRPHPLEITLTALIRDRLVEIVTLRGLTAEGTGALIAGRVGALKVSQALRDLVHDRTEGNPFFTEEVLAAMLEQGTLARAAAEDGRNASQIAVPHSIRSVVGQRIARLAPGVRELLRLAAVLGQEFDLDLLVAAADEPESTVLDHLEAALLARLVEERRSGRTERYAFVHALVAQTLYEEMPPFRPRRLHLRVADALERTRGARADSADLARHLLAGWAAQRALPYLERAGDAAAALDAHVEAVGHFQIAVELRLERGERLEAAALQRKLGIELIRLSRIPEALAVLNAALATYERAGDSTARALVHGNLARAYLAETSYDYQAVLPHLLQALELWPLEQEDRELAQVLSHAARGMALGGDRAAAASLQERLTAIAHRQADPGVQAVALFLTVALDDYQGGSVTQAFVLLDRAVLLAERTGDRELLAIALGNRAIARSRLGDFVAAAADFRRSSEVADTGGTPRVGAFALLNLSDTLTVLGQWEEARSALQRSLALQQLLAISRRLAWLRGNHEEALRLGLDHLQTLRTKGDAQSEALELKTLAGLYLQLDRWSDAYALARDALTFIQARQEVAQVVAYAPSSHAALAEAAAAMRAPDAAKAIREAMAALERQGYEAFRPGALRALAHLLHGQGDVAGALTCLQECAALTRRQGNVVELAMTLALLAQIARSAGDETLAREADAERATIVERIGPETRGLAWAEGVPGHASPS